ncbi:hypothetical protein BH10PAT2_BH10PAT2_2580 [soil metagenome]
MAEPTVIPQDVNGSEPAPQVGMKYSSLGKRFAAVVLDEILSFIIIGFIIGLTGNTTADGSVMSSTPALLTFAFTLAYFVGMEGSKGQTLGKMALKMKVVKEDGSAISYKEALIRQVLKVIDFLFIGILGAVVISKSPIKQRVGDKVAHTVVIDV